MNSGSHNYLYVNEGDLILKFSSVLKIQFLLFSSPQTLLYWFTVTIRIRVFSAIAYNLFMIKSS